MKRVLNSLFILILLIAPVDALAASGDEQPTFEIPKQLTFRFELQNSPELATAGSWWEISIQLHIAEPAAYSRYLAQKKSGQTNIPEPGVVLIKKSFPHRDLSKGENSHVEVEVPVRGDLFERFKNIKKSPQVIWLSSSVRVHAGKLNADSINNDVNPIWDLRYFIDRAANVKLTLAPSGQLTWSSGKSTTAVRK
jgi:hypothetical protein